MTLELAQRQNLSYVDCPGWIALLAGLIIWLEVGLRKLGPITTRRQVWALVQIDRARKAASVTFEGYNLVFRLGAVFIIMYLAYLAIELI